MNRAVLGLLLGAALLGGGAYAVWSRGEGEASSAAPAPVAPAPAAEAHQPAVDLAMSELLAPEPPLRPSAKARGLAGQRVRMVGFMAQMELPPRGAFYLVPHPVHCDEAGGGTADLPLESVLVVSKSAAGQAIAFLSGSLEVTGILEIGNRPDEDGRVSAIRLILDGPGPHPPESARAAAP